MRARAGGDWRGGSMAHASAHLIMRGFKNNIKSRANRVKKELILVSHLRDLWMALVTRAPQAPIMREMNN